MDKPPFSFSDLVQVIGAPAAMMAVFCWFWIRGYIVTIRELEKREAMKDALIARLDKQLEDKQVEALRWRDNAFDNMRDLRDAHVAIRTLMRKIPKLKADDTHDEGEGEGPC